MTSATYQGVPITKCPTRHASNFKTKRLASTNKINIAVTQARLKLVSKLQARWQNPESNWTKNQKNQFRKELRSLKRGIHTKLNTGELRGIARALL